MELKDTVELMISGDWKDRLIAEYVQVRIRIKKLENYVSCLTDKEQLSAEEEAELDSLYDQHDTMRSYEIALRSRIADKHIDLSKYVDYMDMMI